MKSLVAIFTSLTLVGISAITSVAAAAEPQVVGGMTPDRRPEGFPKITTYEFDSKRALHGISKPYPTSIEQWLDDQGAWFTPFNRPGMTGHYDIRDWYGKYDG
jgi:hypothetical protein